MKLSRITATLMVMLCSMVPSDVLACAVCFGDKNSQMGKAADAGVLTLLLIIMAVLVGVASFFIYLVRRSASVEQQNPQNSLSSSSN